MTKDKEHKVGEYIPMLEQKQNPYYLATHMGEGWQDGFDGKPVRSTFDGYKLGYVEGNTARKALSQPELELMYAKEKPKLMLEKFREMKDLLDDTTPPQRTWVGLTDEEAQQTFAKHNCTISTHLAGILARAIEAKLKEKNT